MKSTVALVVVALALSAVNASVLPLGWGVPSVVVGHHDLLGHGLIADHHSWDGTHHGVVATHHGLIGHGHGLVGSSAVHVSTVPVVHAAAVPLVHAHVHHEGFVY